jgi:hypothetical protein
MEQSSRLRYAIPFFVVSFFLLYFFSSGVQSELSLSILNKGSGLPDFGKYRHIGTVSAERLSLDDPNRRAIIVGDIHGMKSALDDLLNHVSYDEKKDTLIHLGDIITKGPHAGSLSVLSFMSEHNISGVRGNHDQQVIEWRTWLDWIHSLEGGAGSRWLQELEEKWKEENQGGELDDDSNTETWVGTQMLEGQKDRKWWSRVPKGWKLFSDHYRIAKAMSKQDYEYLLSLPLVLHLPSEHTFLVHAGLLPYDPTLSITSKKQPLAHLPKIPSRVLGGSIIPTLRNAQELAILEDIKQNTNPWVVLNIRNLRKDNKPSRKTNKGKAWTKVWNEIISRCVGFERTALGAESSLPCHPSTVIYGHTASRGLDVHRWSVGIDTGCAYGRRLTALILDNAHSHMGAVSPGAYEDDNEDGIESSSGTLPFGDSGQAKLFSVKCHKHK